MLSGKQREIQAREGLFLDTARSILLEEGYENLSISRVAEVTQFSKGTVYQQFSSKEEMVAALGIGCRSRLLSAIEHGGRYPGRPRERLIAIGEGLYFYVLRHPHDQRILKIIDAETILQRVGEEQQAKMAEYDIRVFQVLMSIVLDAIEAGDLHLPADVSPQSICFAYWAMVDGVFSAMMGGAPLEAIGITDPLAEVVRNGQRLADGYGWHPLSHEIDYSEISQRIRSQYSSDDSGVTAEQNSGVFVSK